MSCFRTPPRIQFALALLGTAALWACDDRSIQSPSEPLAARTDALLRDPSKKALIAFSSNRDGVNSEIYVMNPDGRKQTRLTNDSASDGHAAWSPDRTRIAFTKVPIRDPFGIYIMNAEGTNPTLFATGGENPDWSPDGSKIAFGRNGEIVVRNVDGSGETTFSTDLGWVASDPDWSPDGTRIVFLRTEGGGGAENIWVANADGTNQAALTSSDFDRAPAWSPDGSKIAFQSQRAGNSEIFVMNADGSGQTALTSSATLSHAPTWSPDGSKIAFQRFAGDGTTDIYVMNADGSGLTQLTTDPGSDASPGWAR
jgi:Tol biopolymer transport system component